MSFNTYFITRGLISLGLFGLAGYLLTYGLDGWGWCLFIGFLCIPRVGSKDDDDSEDDD